MNLVYFSPTGSTQSVLRAIVRGMDIEIVEYDVTDYSRKDIKLHFGAEDFVLFGYPVYSGRVPETFRERLEGVKGQDSPAVLIATYGNREYEDALLEMKNLASENGFRVIGAAAVVTEHSVIRSVAAGRPDAQDIALIAEFSAKLKRKIEEVSIKECAKELSVPGNAKYRKYRKIPMTPVASVACTACGLCAKKCPAGAIDARTPRMTDKGKCIGCMRCVRICPPKARRLSKIKMLAGECFLSGAKRVRKEPEMFL